MISIEGLNKTYQSGTQAVKNLNLSVERGEILALLGPNGAGKSTTIRVLTTLSGFDEGKVEVAGFDVDRNPEQVRQAIGYVAQETGIDYFLTGRENLTLQGRMYRMSKADIAKRIDELSAYFELADMLDQQVAAYSGGMRRKLDIATALIHQPRVLFLDEPTLGLDTKSRQSLWRYIERLNKELQLTILLTTHYLEEADKLSDRVAIINQGEIKVIDTADALKSAIQGDVVSMEFEDDSAEMQSFTWQLQQEKFVKDATWESDKFHIYVSNGAEAIPNVMEAATNARIKVRNISFARPTLDDVFIQYTGNSLQGDKEEGGEEWWHKWAGKGGGSNKWAKKWQQAQDATSEGGDSDSQWWKSEANTDHSGDAQTVSEDWQKWQQPNNQTETAAEKPPAASDKQNWQQWQNSDQSRSPDAKTDDPKQTQWPEQNNWREGDWKKDDWK